MLHFFFSIYIIFLLDFSLQSYYDLPDVSLDSSELTLRNLMDNLSGQIGINFLYRDITSVSIYVSYFSIIFLINLSFYLFLNLSTCLSINTLNEALLNTFYILRCTIFLVIYIPFFYLTHNFFTIKNFGSIYTDLFRPNLSSLNNSSNFTFTLESFAATSVISKESYLLYFFSPLTVSSLASFFFIAAFYLSSVIVKKIFFDAFYSETLSFKKTDMNSIIFFDKYFNNSMCLSYLFYTWMSFFIMLLPFVLLITHVFLYITALTAPVYIFLTVWNLSLLFFYFKLHNRT